MAEFFRKTDLGRRELRERRLGLPRVGRNLLLIIDGTRPVRDWVAMIQGASMTDAAALLDMGLIEPGTGRTPGDSELANLYPTMPAALATSPQTLPAGWTRPGALSRLGDLPSPGAELRHVGALGTSLPTMPAGLVPTPPIDARQRGAARGPASQAGSRAAETPPARDSSPGPSTLPPLEGLGGFVPLDVDGSSLGPTGLSHSELYESLNALVRETLGLLKGYRYTLRIERARNVTELEAVAADFVAEVRRVRGESMARMVERALGLAG
jgi:hypothetical protein